MSDMSRFDRSIVAYAQWLLRARWWVVLGSLLAVAAFTYGVQNLKFSTDYRVYFGKDNPQLQAFDEVQNVYAKSDNVLFVIEPRDGDVFTPRVLEAVRAVTAEAWKLPYTLRVDSITNFQHTEANDDDLNVAPVLGEDEDISPERVAKLREVALHEPLLLRRLISPTGHVTAVNISTQFPPLDQQTQKELPEAIAAVRALRARILADYPEVKEVYLSGSNMMSQSFTEAAKADMVSLVPAMYAAIFVIMAVMLRSVWATFGTLLVVFFSAMSAMGIAGYIGIGLSPPVVQAPQIITVLAIADSVHICLTMFALMREGWDKHAAIVESMRLNFVPVFLTSATTSICFLGTNFTDSPPLTALGNISSIGGMLSWAFAMSMLPALLAILPARVPRERKVSWITTAMDRLGDFVLKNRKPVFWSALLTVTGLTALAPLNEANDHFAHFFDESIRFRTDTDYTVDNLTGLYSIEFSLKSGEPNGIADPEYLRKVQAFADWWHENPKVLYVGTVTDVFKKLNKSMHGDDAQWYSLPDNRELAAQYLLLYEISLPFGLDLNNQINIDKSSTRFVVVLKHLKSRETREIEESAQAWLSANAPGMETLGVSPAVMFAYISERNIRSNFLSLPFCMAAISLLLLPGLRSLRFGLLSLVPNLLPLGMAFGVWYLIDGEIIFTQAVVLNMVVGIIVDNTIHFLNKYLRARRQMGRTPEQAIHFAFHEASSAMIVTTLILASGFFILAQSAFLPNSNMALLTTIAILLALPVNLLLLPQLVLLIDRRRAPASTFQESSDADVTFAAK
ncbi:MAG: MMPL family transporter [Sinimarinibacterium sp.]|jgi:hypothetical protein